MLAALLGASTARAQAPATPVHARVKLEYTAAPELACPDRDAFASAIATRLGYEAITTDAAEDGKTLSVTYRREGAALRATLRLSNAAREIESEKSLVSETGACTELGAAAAFAAAILLDPRAMFPRPKAPPGGGPSLDSNAPGTWPWYEPRSPLPPPPPPPPPPETPWLWRAGAGATACIGCAPSVSPGAALFFGVAKGRLGVDIGVRAELPESVAAPSGRTASSSVVLGELFPHARLGPARLGVVGTAGALFGDSNGDKQVSPLGGVGPRVALEWTVITPVFVRIAVDGEVVLGRVSLRVEGVELWSTPAVIAGANLGVGVQL